MILSPARFTCKLVCACVQVVALPGVLADVCAGAHHCFYVCVLTLQSRVRRYFGSDFLPIRVRELDATRIAFAGGSSEVAVVKPSGAPYEALVEGAWLQPGADGVLYLYYSGNNCCGATAHYAGNMDCVWA
jgi:hypothetical protein